MKLKAKSKLQIINYLEKFFKSEGCNVDPELNTESNLKSGTFKGHIKERKKRARSAKISNFLFNKYVKINSVKDLFLDHIPVRIYKESEEENQPLILFFHCGGFLFFDEKTMDYTLRRICKSTNSTIVSVGYRKAPEHRFPAAHDDAKTALKWCLKNAEELGCDPNKIIVMGNGSGGNLAAYLAQLSAEDPQFSVAGQILIYPWLDMTLSYHSMYDLHSPLFCKRNLEQSLSLYFASEEERTHPNANVLSSSHFDSFPPTLILTSDKDILKDEGREFARLLSDHDVMVDYWEYPNTPKGFLFFPDAFEENAHHPLTKIQHFVGNSMLYQNEIKISHSGKNSYNATT